MSVSNIVINIVLVKKIWAYILWKITIFETETILRLKWGEKEKAGYSKLKSVHLVWSSDLLGAGKRFKSFCQHTK